MQAELQSMKDKVTKIEELCRDGDTITALSCLSSLDTELKQVLSNQQVMQQTDSVEFLSQIYDKLSSLTKYLADQKSEVGENLRRCVSSKKKVDAYKKHV